MSLHFFSPWRRLFLAAFVWAVCLCGGLGWQPDVRSQTNPQPPARPILRLETGMHTAAIRRIGVDAAERYLVTASEDKTARVWELATGKLLRVLRPPIGEGDEGKLYAVALSPDGRTVALGGWTGPAGQDENIYLYERESGRMVRRVAGLPNVINHLVYSPDGRWLAATLSGSNGVRVYDTSSYTEVGVDRDYGSDSYGADFDAVGRLVTTCRDSYVRLYQPVSGGLRLVAKRKVEGGNQPLSVRFSPDGRQVAVGFDDSMRVAVLSGSDLKLLYAPDTSGVDNGNLCSVTWTADGKTLVAGGTFLQGVQTPIRLWSDGGRGRYRDVVAADNTILNLLPLRDGGMVYGAFDPAWGVLDGHGERMRFIGPAIADYRDNWGGFLLSSDGARMQFGYEVFGKSPARFAVGERRLEIDVAGVGELTAPRTSGLAVSDWKYTYAPKLDGKPLKLDGYEMSRSLAIAPNGARFLLGTDFWLRLFDRNSKELWQKAIPGTAWGVNISGDGRLVVAAFGDGTIRWYRLTDGKELLAFFPHKDKQRWVLWTPQGYYDASPGAEELIGWHVNNGPDAAADFYSVSQFRSTYYRPDVIDRVLKTLDEDKAIEQANLVANRRREEDLLRRLPPVVEIVAPASEVRVTAPALKLRYRVRSPSGLEITAVKILIDGRPDTSKGQGGRPPQAGATVEADVTLPERNCEVSVIAETNFAASQPASVRVVWAGGVPSFLKPSLYLLAVGVNDDREPETEPLQFAGKDAEDFAAVMKAQEGGLYGKVVTRVLTGPRASKDQILDGFDWLIRETTARDVAMILLSGHGLPDHGRYFFMTSSAERARLLATAVSFAEIKGLVEVIPGKVVFFLDTCHSGNALGTARGPFDLNRVISELASAENGAVVFASSTGRQRSYENATWKNGAFTKAVIEGINGRADLFNHGKISVETLGAWIAQRVKELTNNEQSPVVLKPGSVPDFPVAVKNK